MKDDMDLATLTAYVDGELCGDDVRELEARLQRDPAARGEVRRIREETAALRSAYNDILVEDLPHAVVSTLNNAVKEPSKAPGEKGGLNFGFWRLPGYSLATAVVLAVLLAGPAGYFFASQQYNRDNARQKLQLMADQDAMAAAMLEALEKHVSGKSASWENPESGSRGSITPVRTFKNSDGSWCREYREASEFLNRREERRAIACRTMDGVWETRLITYEDS